MGKKRRTNSDWDDDELLDSDETDPSGFLEAATGTAPRGRLTWRLIEQAREARALREQLEDFGDYA